MVTFHDWIFDEALFKQAAIQFEFKLRIRTRAQAALEQFQRAWMRNRLQSAGRYIKITEIKAQQAFNHLVFHDILGFTDLMYDGNSYSILPEVSFSFEVDEERTARPRADLAIGVFSAESAAIVGVAEHKSPNADLNKAQRGISYRSSITDRQLSAAEQALEAMRAATCEWALISNLNQICLIHKSNPEHALSYNLAALDTDGLRDFFFAFSPGGFCPLDGQSTRLEKVLHLARRLKK